MQGVLSLTRSKFPTFEAGMLTHAVLRRVTVCKGKGNNPVFLFLFLFFFLVLMELAL